MRINLAFLVVCVLVLSCRKESPAVIEYSEASYTVEVTGKWSAPHLTVPGGAHFTLLTGMVHNKHAFLWKAGNKASLGVENIAERGDISQLKIEIDSMIAEGNASFLFLLGAPLPTGFTTGSIFLTSNFPYFSFETMIAPTPDWFTGLSGFELYRNNKWIADTTVNLFVYDAGTEDGDVFGYTNPATSPQQTVALLTPVTGSVLANGHDPIRPIATIRFRKR